MPANYAMADDRIYIHGIFNQMEERYAVDPYLRWDGQAGQVNDLNKRSRSFSNGVDVPEQGSLFCPVPECRGR